MKQVYATPSCEIIRFNGSESIMEVHIGVGSKDATTSGDAKQYNGPESEEKWED